MTAAEQRALVLLLTDACERERRLRAAPPPCGVDADALERASARLVERRLVRARHALLDAGLAPAALDEAFRRYARETPPPPGDDPHADARCFLRVRRRNPGAFGA